MYNKKLAKIKKLHERKSPVKITLETLIEIDISINQHATFFLFRYKMANNKHFNCFLFYFDFN